MSEMVTLTKEILEAAKSCMGGYSAVQMMQIGINYPLMPGWRKTVLGKEFPKEKLEEFIRLKDQHLTPGKIESRLRAKRKRLARKAEEEK